MPGELHAVVADAAALGSRVCLAELPQSDCAISGQPSTAWRRDQPSGSMRLAQWNLDPGYYEDANLVVFYLPLGPSVEAQLSRWEGEFPEAARTTAARRTGRFDIDAGSPVFLEVSGAWTGGGPARSPEDDDAMPLTEGYGLCAAVVPAARAVDGAAQMAYFVKATGPRGVVERASPTIVAFVESLRLGA